MEKIIDLKFIDPVSLFGIAHSHIKMIEAEIKINIIARDQKIKLIGGEKEVNQVDNIFGEMLDTLNGKGALSKKNVSDLISLIKRNNFNDKSKDFSKYLICYSKKGAIRPQTNGQIDYVKSVYDNDIVFCNGPAGTGKTFLAVSFAFSALEKGIVDRIILCRPAVEAGENLGFLPGDLKDKVDPYLAPLYDALNILIDEKKLIKLLENKVIEIVPLAYMRGRTLDNAFMILDEAQNATVGQMKMFLARLGIGSKSIITGDITQIDLNTSIESGLVQVAGILNQIDGIDFIKLNQDDVVRHSLVKKILQAYEKL